MEDVFEAPPDWQETSRRVEEFVRRFFRGRSEVDPDDVTQEVLLDLLRRVQQGEVADLARLATVIAHRRCIDALRRAYAGRRFTGLDTEAESDAIRVRTRETDETERGEVRALFLSVRGRLTARCRAVLDQLLLGLRLAEVGRALGTSAGAVRNRWFFCRRQILALFEKRGLEAGDLI